MESFTLLRLHGWDALQCGRMTDSCELVQDFSTSPLIAKSVTWNKVNCREAHVFSIYQEWYYYTSATWITTITCSELFSYFMLLLFTFTTLTLVPISSHKTSRQSPISTLTKNNLGGMLGPKDWSPISQGGGSVRQLHPSHKGLPPLRASRAVACAAQRTSCTDKRFSGLGQPGGSVAWLFGLSVCLLGWWMDSLKSLVRLVWLAFCFLERSEEKVREIVWGEALLDQIDSSFLNSMCCRDFGTIFALSEVNSHLICFFRVESNRNCSRTRKRNGQ